MSDHINQAECEARLQCEIALEYSDRVNFAMQQNRIPLVDSVRITSCDAEALEDVAVRLALDNGESAPWTGRFAAIGPGATVSAPPTGFALSARQLAGRTEAERTSIVVEVAAGGLRRRESFPIDLLPFDQWPGVGHYPEMTAAFVTPNHPRIAELLGAARESLRSLDASDALDGYQSGSRRRAAQIAEACFHAVASRRIGYINPPASFERDGQRVRLADRICRENIGTCLDLSLLLMAMWEQCGLHPLLLMPEGHAMPAVWTHESHLPEAAIDEPARIRNLIELGEIVPVEATCITHEAPSFADAVTAAKRHMETPGPGFCAIDIRAGRKRGIRPLPLRDDGSPAPDGGPLDARLPATVEASLDPVELAERAEGRSAAAADPADELAAETGHDRINRWQARLLDLSLRNRLINFRVTGRTIPLEIPDLARLEDLLAGGARLTIHPRTEGDDAYRREELASCNIYSAEAPAEMQKRLLTIYRTAKASIEETGANLLHLALGLLKWYETEGSDTPRLAPLILLPIRLHRASTGSGYLYSLELSDEPLRPNVTLLEKLRTEFGIDTSGLDDLPEDESGLDVPLILRNFRTAIRHSSRWEVVESACIGLFSFNKFLMWRDLQENLERLKQSRLVGHLVDRPGEDFDADPFPRPDELDDQAPPGAMLCTRDADSSQLAAVRAAADQRTFVLEGPPGTGKSQTIANIIADALARGRRVLFVAEKMAALSVVRTRLEQDGLGPFCLELHSAKASKNEVLAQLEQALGAPAPGEPPEWDALCRELGETRARLNEYVREMHLPRASGETLYQALGRLSRLGDGSQVPLPTLPADDVAAVTGAELDTWRRLIADLHARAAPIDPPHEHPLRGIGQAEWRFGLLDEAREAIDRGRAALGAVAEAAGRFIDAAGGPGLPADLGRASLAALPPIASLLQRSPLPDRRLIHGSEAVRLRSTIAAAGDLDRRRRSQSDELLQRYRPEFLEFDHLVHIDVVQRALRQSWLVRLLTFNGARRRLRMYCTGKVPPLADLLRDLELARETRRLAEDFASRSQVADLLGARWNDGAPDWDDVEQLLTWSEDFSQLLEVVDADPGSQGLAAILADAASDRARAERAAVAGAALVPAWSAWESAWDGIRQTLAPSPNAIDDDAAAWLDEAGAILSRWSSGLDDLNNWCAWQRARSSAAEAGLDGLIKLIESGAVGREDLADAFERSFARRWFNTVANQVPAVRGFNAEAHSDSIARFKSLDQRSIQLTRDVVAARLKAAAPTPPAQASGQSEVGILRRELAKKRRHLPTRRLIEAMPTLLPRLKPCFLMSPLSVAQYLDTNLPPFDLVVFDEASQIPVWDAIGAIARGATVVVVGDSKQLPPTTFFNTLDSDDDSAESDLIVEDMESILKECNASGIPAMRLRWHYRSRHESLIAFSNHHYYQNELHTFPSPEERSPRLGVTFCHIPDGVYDRGGSRTNRIEADQVVAAVVQMLLDPGNDDSIGIVTFNQAQQSLIEDLFDAKRREMPELEPHFTGETPEPVFIKNLENVQGDERDTIVFSVGYGPDQTGRASMNFGPLNKDGGERRLNVAVTRARRRLLVFSSLMSDQIDLKRTRAVGVRDFKTFLDYAKRGPQAIAEAVALGGRRDFDSGFEQSVCRALTELGWEVDTQVGCAGYRIDLAVRHPEAPGRYLLGIECDGATYHSARTARDRDRLRQSVLEGLGWRVARVWSTQWQVSPQRTLARLVGAIEQALRAANGPPAPAPVEAPPPAPGVSQGPDEGPPAPDDGTATESGPTGSGGGGLAEGRAPAATMVEPRDSIGRLKEYEIAALPDAQRAGLDIFERASSGAVAQALQEIVECEGPIVEALAMRRLAEALGITRIHGRFRDHFTEICRACIDAQAVILDDGALWPASLSIAEYDGFRIPGEAPETKRDIEHIPQAELVNAVAHVLTEQFGMPRDELLRETARLLGIQRITPRIAEALNLAVDRAIAAGKASDAGGQVSLAL